MSSNTVHTNINPLTGDCLDCGANKEQIDDNLFPVCEKITGPHRLAIIAVRNEAMVRGYAAESYEQRARIAEDEAARYSQGARRLRADERALKASLEYLKGATGEKPLPLAETVARLGRHPG